VRIEPGQDRGPTGRAERGGDEGIAEMNTLARHPVERRCIAERLRLHEAERVNIVLVQFDDLAIGHRRRPPRRGQRKLGEFRDHAGETGVAQRLLHRGQHIGVRSGLDEDHPGSVEPGEVERRCEQVGPAQRPDDHVVGPGKDAGEEDGRRRIVRQVARAGDLMFLKCSD